jgi:carbon-monoxide dehydrogenase large subunit
MSGSGGKIFGRSVPRLEDRDLVLGRGRFVDDLRPEGCVAAAFLRSAHAHAKIQTIDVEAARKAPGVIAVLTIEDLAPFLTGLKLSVGLPSSSILIESDRPILAADEVLFVGDPFALVLASTRAEAEDAIDMIVVDYEPLPAVADCRISVTTGSPTVHSSFPHNRLAEFGFAYGDTDAAFAAADRVVSGSYSLHRGGAHSMEGRGILAVPDALTGRLTVWSSTQTPVALKKTLCELLGLSEQDLIVEMPDLGGGFGPKLVTYPEEVAVAAAALATGRPIKWIEDRREHFLSATQERDQHWDVEMALAADGRILGLRGTMLHDHGAYTARGLNVPYGSGVTLPLPYNIPAYKLDVTVALTNLVPVTPIRGAGQPQAVFVMERMLDRAARALRMDRAEIRRRNLVTADSMPCTKPLKLRGGTNVILDSGDYPATQDSALSRADWNGFAVRRADALARGRCLGIGIANYVEGTGRGPYESVRVRLARTGRIMVSTAAAAMGQGTATMLAQIVAEAAGCDPALVSVKTGDTSDMLGFGGFNSRQTVVAGAAAHDAATSLREKMLVVAGHLLGRTVGDLTVAGDSVHSRTDPAARVGFGRLAAAAAGLPGFQLPGIDSPGLDFTGRVIINDMAYSNGTAVAEVEIDPATGHVDVRRLVLAHDCGRMVNPANVDGQIQGGLVHGLGNALFERMLFDEDAQPLTTTLADYLLVTAAELPDITILHSESPSPLNALGVKGVGESGTIPVVAAVMSAVDDALSDLDVHIDTAPLSPPMLREFIRAAQAAAGGAHG